MSGLFLSLLLSVARAQDPTTPPTTPPTGPPTGPPTEQPVPAETPPVEAPPVEVPQPVAPSQPDAPVEEIVVWGELAVAKARDDIAREMERLGYRVARKDDGRIIFRGPSKVTLLPSGTLLFSAGGPRIIEAPPQTTTRDPRYQSIDPGPMTGGGLSMAVPGGGKSDAARTRILDETRDEIDNYIAIIRRTAFEEMLQALPERLDQLWRDGTPFDSGDPSPDPEARRQAVLELWATRTDTPEGRRAAAAISAWLDAVVQPSQTPITDAERSAFEARRTDGRTLP